MTAGGLPAPGERFGEHELLEVLGQGGMGVVYRARQVSLGREVALKMISPAYARDPEFRERFHREATLQAAMDSHPHIVTVLEHGEHDGILFISTQLVRGGDLRQRITARGPLPPADAVELAAQIASALAESHRHGVVHRDVKPNNILLRHGDETFGYLGDFGVAQPRDSELTTVGGVVGTYRYMAPERCEGGAATPATDQYALGCVLVAALTGNAPYDGSDLQVARQHLEAAVPRLPVGHPAAAALDPVLGRMLAKSPSARFPDLDAVREVLAHLDLQDASSTSTVLRPFVSTPAPTPAPAPGPYETVLRPAPAPDPGPDTVGGTTRHDRRRSPVLVLLAAAAALAALVAIALVVVPRLGDEDATASSTTPGAPAASGSGSARSQDAPTPGPLANLEGLASYENLPCSDDYIVIVKTVSDPVDVTSKTSSAVAEVPGAYQAKYLETGRSCEDFRQLDDDGNPIYNVYVGPFSTPAEACQARSSLVGENSPQAWVRQVNTTSSLYLCACLSDLTRLPDVRRPGPFIDDLPLRRLVSDVQMVLHADNYNRVRRSAGLYNRETAEWVRQWQADNGLSATGVIDTETWRTMVGGYCAEPRDPDPALRIRADN